MIETSPRFLHTGVGHVPKLKKPAGGEHFAVHPYQLGGDLRIMPYTELLDRLNEFKMGQTFAA